jgi:hypothetical protein
MRMKINKADRVVEPGLDAEGLGEQDAEELDMREQSPASLTVIPTSKESPVRFHLGSPEKKEKPLSDLTGVTKFSVPDLLRLLEVPVNRTHTNEEGYYTVRNRHMVSVFVPLLLWKANTYIYGRSRNSIICGSATGQQSIGKIMWTISVAMNHSITSSDMIMSLLQLMAAHLSLLNSYPFSNFRQILNPTP